MSKVVVNTAQWEKLQKELIKLGKAHAKVGIFAARGGNSDHEGISILELAAIHEFGSPAVNIPERSFIRGTFQNNQRDLAKITAQLGKQVASFKITHKQALSTLGLWGEAQVKKYVTTGSNLKALKASTIAAKGSTRPLVDTGRLVNSVTHEVSE